jgi:predicted kinase
MVPRHGFAKVVAYPAEPDRRMHLVVSGAPATGKSTMASMLSRELGIPVLSLDVIKETMADSLGLGDEAWSDALGDAAAEVVFRLAGTVPASISEGWWRRERRPRAIKVFQGRLEVFCTCAPERAVAGATARIGEVRHAIHRDVINPLALETLAEAVATTLPLDLGGGLVQIDTTKDLDAAHLLAQVRRLVN